MVSFIPAVLSMCSSGCVLRLQFQRAGLTRGGEGGLQLQLYRLGNAHTRLAAGWCRLHCAGAAAGGRRENCSRSLQLSTPQVASCELLPSCQPGEGGYSLARPPAPPQVGNIENPPSQSHSLAAVSRCQGQVFQSAFLETVATAAGSGSGLVLQQWLDFHFYKKTTFHYCGRTNLK